MILIQTWVVLFVLLALHQCTAQMGKSTVTKNANDKMSGTISMGPPDLTDEETQDNFMPSRLRCDACLGITHRFEKVLEKDVNKIKAIKNGKKKISESRLIEIFEDICGDRNWNGYGIKEVEGVKRLSYPGSDVADIPGIMQGGGQWPRRLADMCYTYVGQHEEYGIYKAYMRDRVKGVYKLLCTADCQKRAMNEL